MRPFVVGLVAGLLASAAMAQTMVEAVVITGAGATAAGKAKGMSGAIGAVLGKVNSALASAAGGTPQAASSSRSTAATGAPPAARSEPARPMPSRTELESVEKGIPREELLAKLGPPAFRLTKSDAGRLEEVLDYTARDGGSARVRLTDGKVSSVDWPDSR